MACRTLRDDGWTTNEVQKSLKEIDSQRETSLEAMQLPRGLKTYTMAVTQGLWNSGLEVWCDYALDANNVNKT